MNQSADNDYISAHTIRVQRHTDGRYKADSPGSGLSPSWGSSEREAINTFKNRLDNNIKDNKSKGL